MERKTDSIDRNHKGEWCAFKVDGKPLLCQEEFCKGCQIFLDFMRKTDKLIEELWGK